MKYINIFLFVVLNFIELGFLKAELSSYEELVVTVANEANVSKAQAEGIIDLTFGEITQRLIDKKGTSIPEFGRFYVQEKYPKSDSGDIRSKKSVLSPRFSMAPELKKKVGGLR